MMPGAVTMPSKQDVHAHVINCPLQPPPTANEPPGYFLNEDVIARIRPPPRR